MLQKYCGEAPFGKILLVNQVIQQGFLLGPKIEGDELLITIVQIEKDKKVEIYEIILKNVSNLYISDVDAKGMQIVLKGPIKHERI